MDESARLFSNSHVIFPPPSLFGLVCPLLSHHSLLLHPSSHHAAFLKVRCRPSTSSGTMVFSRYMIIGTRDYRALGVFNSATFYKGDFVGEENEVSRSHKFPLHGTLDSMKPMSCSMRYPFRELVIPAFRVPVPVTKLRGERSCVKLEFAKG